MGEEYGEDTPFLFFTDYTDKTLRKKSREVGRKKEVIKNGWKKTPVDSETSVDVFDIQK